MQNLQFTYLMNAKVLHDLASPLSSIGMGIELIEDEMIKKTLHEGYFASYFKLSFYRLLLSTSDQGPDFKEVMNLLNTYAARKNISIDWKHVSSDLFIDHPHFIRLLLGTVFLALESLIRGGQCVVKCNTDGVFIEANGQLCKMRDAYKKLFKNRLDDSINVQNIFLVFLFQLADQENCRLHFKENVDSLTLSIQ